MNKTKERPTSQPITVNIDKLSAMLSCGHATARKIGEQAGASKAINFGLKSLGLETAFVSRYERPGTIQYEKIT